MKIKQVLKNLTFIEILVVVAIIALLFSMILTAVMRAKNTDEETTTITKTGAAIASTRVVFVGSLYTIRHDNHQYIVVNTSNGVGILHGPDCSCKNEQNND